MTSIIKEYERRLEVMKAYEGGADIQFIHHHQCVGFSSADWLGVSAPTWEWYKYNYRVKPAKPREFWIYNAKTPDASSYVEGYEGEDEGYVAAGWIHVKEVL